MDTRRIDPASLTLSLVGIVFSFLIPLVTYPCSIVALVLAARRRKERKTTAALVLSIVGLAIALINSILGVYSLSM